MKFLNLNLRFEPWVYKIRKHLRFQYFTKRKAKFNRISIRKPVHKMMVKWEYNRHATWCVRISNSYQVWNPTTFGWFSKLVGILKLFAKTTSYYPYIYIYSIYKKMCESNHITSIWNYYSINSLHKRWCIQESQPNSHSPNPLIPKT